VEKWHLLVVVIGLWDLQSQLSRLWQADQRPSI
jgi:hypothetical protein